MDLLTAVRLSGGDDADALATNGEDDDVEAFLDLANETKADLSVVDAVVRFDQVVPISKGQRSVLEGESPVALAPGILRSVPLKRQWASI